MIARRQQRRSTTAQQRLLKSVTGSIGKGVRARGRQQRNDKTSCRAVINDA